MKSSKSSLFLIELIISILFFSLASATCIQLFVKAHLLDKSTRETNQIVMWSQNLAELWHASDGELYPVYERLINDYDADGSKVYLSNDAEMIILYFNKDWELCSLSDTASYAYRIEFSQTDMQSTSRLNTAEINFYKDNNHDYTLIHSLLLSKHTTLERGNIHE